MEQTSIDLRPTENTIPEDIPSITHEPIEPEQKHLFDISKKRLLGQKALASYLGSPEKFPNVYPLRSLLLDNEIEIPAKDIYDRKKWSRAKLVKNGRFIVKVISPDDTSIEKSQSNVNEAVLQRARQLDLLPSLRQISVEFGSTVDFYKKIEAHNTHRERVFDDWEVEDFIDYIKVVGSDIGRKPTEAILWDYSKASPWNNPSPYIISSRIGRGRGIGPAMELAGYMDIYNWTLGDYKDWGVKFMEANDGENLSTHWLNILSPRGMAPSTRAVMNNFGMNPYKEAVSKMYAEKMAQQAKIRNEKINTILAEQKSGKIPSGLLEGAGNDGEIITRYAKFLVADDLLLPGQYTSKISISTESVPSVKELGFNRSIRRVNSAYTNGDIESTALYLGVFDDIWPMDEHMRSLRVIDNEEIRAEYEAERFARARGYRRADLVLVSGSVESGFKFELKKVA